VILPLVLSILKTSQRNKSTKSFAESVWQAFNKRLQQKQPSVMQVGMKSKKKSPTTAPQWRRQLPHP
jgi:hypothetical protein